MKHPVKQPTSQYVTLATKGAFRSRKKTSKFRGVSKCSKDGRWQARIRVGPKVKYLGRYSNEEEAAKAYDKAALGFYGNNATINFDRKDYGEVPRCVLEQKKRVTKPLPNTQHFSGLPEIQPRLNHLPVSPYDSLLLGHSAGVISASEAFPATLPLFLPRPNRYLTHFLAVKMLAEALQKHMK